MLRLVIKLYLIFIFCVNYCFGQVKEAKTFTLDCHLIETENNFDVVKINESIIVYKIVSRKLYAGYFEGFVILKNLPKKYNQVFLNVIIQELMLENDFDELTVFRNCTAIDTYYQAMKPNKSQELFLKENYLGFFNKEIN